MALLGRSSGSAGAEVRGTSRRLAPRPQRLRVGLVLRLVLGVALASQLGHRAAAAADAAAAAVSPGPRAYDADLVRELDERGAQNVFLIWTTDASTLDALAVSCMDSVVAAYGSRVYLFANHLNASDLSAHNWAGTVNLVHYSAEDVMQTTPLADWFPGRVAELRQGRYYFAHLTDMIRFSLVWRHGGLYLDSDVLVIRPISPDKINKLTKSGKDSPWFECAVVYFSPLHPYLKEVLTHITTHYNINDWVSAGPKALSLGGRTKHIKHMPELVPPGAWIGLRWRNAWKVFWPTGKVSPNDYEGCEVVHMWGSVPRGYLKGGDKRYLKGQTAELLVQERIEALRNVPACKLEAL